MDRYFIAFDEMSGISEDEYPVDAVTLGCFQKFELEFPWMNWVMVF
jgi:hypothetical protein